VVNCRHMPRPYRDGLGCPVERYALCAQSERRLSVGGMMATATTPKLADETHCNLEARRATTCAAFRKTLPDLTSTDKVRSPTESGDGTRAQAQWSAEHREWRDLCAWRRQHDRSSNERSSRRPQRESAPQRVRDVCDLRGRIDKTPNRLRFGTTRTAADTMATKAQPWLSSFRDSPNNANEPR
jgi:hypothetical protein